MPRIKRKVARVSPEIRKIQMASSRKGSPISVETAKGIRNTNKAGKKGQLGNMWGM